MPALCAVGCSGGSDGPTTGKSLQGGGPPVSGIVGGTGTFPAGLEHADVVSALGKAGCSWEPCPPLTMGDQCRSW